MSSSKGNTPEGGEQVVLVRLMGGFDVLVAGRPISLPLDAQRLVAFLALEGRPRSRAHVAGRLWSDGSQERAFGNLRSALWRVRREANSLLAADSQSVSLFPGVGTDVRELDRIGRRLTRLDEVGVDLDFDYRPFSGELLAGWYDEWTLVERERVRQVSLHSLESIAIRLLGVRRFAHALEAALAAVALEPLRESAHRVVIEIHLAEGNHCEAIRHYDQFSTLLEEELGLRPSPIIERQIAGLEVAV